MIQFVPLHSKSVLLDFAKNLYTISFPPNERRDFDVALSLQANNLVTFSIIYNKSVPIGILVFWEFVNFVYIEHFAIDPKYRGKGFGALVMRKIISEFNRQIILEVERPDTVDAQRRIRFYQDSGLCLNAKYDYIQPPYANDKEAVPMFFMSKYLLHADEYEKIKNTLYTKVYV